jgi:type 1 glutamine amidotransferase
MASEHTVVYEGASSDAKHIVLVSGDEEYRSEEALPMLGKILSEHHGFKCTVLFAIGEDGTIDPNARTNIPGLEALDDADMMVIATRMRELPDEQMKHIIDYTNRGGPVAGLRTATHPFQYAADTDSVYAKYTFNSKDFDGGYGRQVLGETWVNHHGHHGHESTRGVAADGAADHPVLRGVEDVWGPTDVYGITTLTGDAQALLDGQVLVGMEPDDAPKADTPTMPIAWVKTYTGDEGATSRIFCTTMGASIDLVCEDLRRLVVNACYWCMGLEDDIAARGVVDIVGDFEPTNFGFGTFQKGVRPSDHAR